MCHVVQLYFTTSCKTMRKFEIVTFYYTVNIIANAKK